MSTGESPTFISAANITRSPNWRVVYGNIIGITWADTEARLNISFDQDVSKPGSSVLEEITVVMPHRAAKILAFSLGLIVSNFEAANGPIPIPVERLQDIEQAIKGQAKNPE